MAIKLVTKNGNIDLTTPPINTGGGGGAVSSVNGKIGAVVLDAKDVGAATLEDIENAKEIYIGSGEAPENVDLQIDLSGEVFVLNPDAKTEEMQTPVGIDAEGKLWTTGNSGESIDLTDYATKEYVDKAIEDIDLPTGGDSGIYEEIAYIETQEEVQTVNLSEKLDGTPLNETNDFIIEIICAPCTNNSNDNSNVNLFIDNKNVAIKTGMVYKNTYYTTAFFPVSPSIRLVWTGGGNKTFYYGTNKNSIDSKINDPTFTTTRLNNNIVNKIAITCAGGSFGIGTSIKVWGRK